MWLSRFLVPFLVILVIGLLYGVEDIGESCPNCRYLSCIPMPFWEPPDERLWNCDMCELGGKFEFHYYELNQSLVVKVGVRAPSLPSRPLLTPPLARAVR